MLKYATQGLLHDRVKLLAYRIFDPSKAPLLTKALLSTEPAKKPVDRTPDIATRAYEIYEDRGRHDGQADQDWLEAEREVRKQSA